MILQSLIKDASYLSLDCVKTKLVKGSIIEIADRFYWEKEIQNAISGGFICVIGNPPKNKPPEPESPKEERKIKLVCNPRVIGTIAFDCVKSFVKAGGSLSVPESRIDHPEIQNALEAGILLDPESRLEATEVPVHSSVSLTEVSVNPEEAMSGSPRQRTAGSRNRRRTRQSNSPVSARPIRRGGSDGSIDPSGVDVDTIDGESPIREPNNSVLADLGIHIDAEPPSSPDTQPPTEPEEPSLPAEPEKQQTIGEPKVIESTKSISFIDIFGE